jgi:DNA invertase Pin-like site-specific DNA recombinase
MTRHAAYIRTSTTKQTTGAQSQRGAILEWFADDDVTDWDEYADAAQSGADDSHEAFRELLEVLC